LCDILSSFSASLNELKAEYSRNHNNFIYLYTRYLMKNTVYFKIMLVILVFGCGVLFAQTRTLYFLPPNDDRWIAGNSYLYNADSSKATLMQVDTSAGRCGWFKMEFRTGVPIPQKVMFYLGSTGRDKVDSNGRGAKIDDQRWIQLRTKFGSSNTLYIVADNLPSGYYAQTATPSDVAINQDRCSYKMAAFIYDTDRLVNPSFCGIYDDCKPDDNNNGLRRGIVKPDLDTATKKPTYAKTGSYANWVDAESFTAAFTSKGLYKGKISNIPRCYDMPISRVSNGTWEFDSDRMRPPNTTATGANNLVGGFYPYVLDKRSDGKYYDEDGSEADYSDCPSCGDTYTANCFNPMNNTSLNNVPALAYKGQTYNGLAAFERANDRLHDGWNNGTSGSTPYSVYQNYNVYDCGNPSGQPRPGFDGAKKENANLSFCFESHGVFAYEKGQEFFFRGDDDIWVFINNRLVIDLGGVHGPVPGFVDLDSITTPEPLVEGESYPIDIFFCERLATQSNVRISTNMYITQKNNFYGRYSKPEQPLCLNKISSGTDCASRLDGNSTGSKPVLLCGKDLEENGYTIDLYMVNNATKEKYPLSLSNTNCKATEDGFVCYTDGTKDGGIRLENGTYYCGSFGNCSKNGEKAISRLRDLPVTGTEASFNVEARLIDNDNKQVGNIQLLDVITIKLNTSPHIVWGQLEKNKTVISLKNAYGDPTTREQNIIAGKPTPIYIAGGDWKDGSYTTFEYETDQQAIKSISYSIDGVTGGLSVIYIDSLGFEVPAIFPRKLPSSGIDTLYLKGSYDASSEPFSINIAGVSENEDSPSLKITVYQPKLMFTHADFDFKNPVNPSGYIGFNWPGTEGNPSLPPFVGNQLDVYLVAWDSERNELCSHCNFILKETSFTNNDSINNINHDAIVESDARRIVNGTQAIFIRGRDKVMDNDYATWRVYGPSEGITFAVWDKLQFRVTMLPVPVESYIYDRNGDGIGDKLIIQFSKSFKSDGEFVDKLFPVLIGVIWDKEADPVYFHAPGHSVAELKITDNIYNWTSSQNAYDFYAKNAAYWKQFIPEGRDSILVIEEPNTKFSNDILTYGRGSLLSYTPYYDEGYCPDPANCTTRAAFRYPLSNAFVLDRISPIVVKADYAMLDPRPNECAEVTGVNGGCKEGLMVYLSEPVFADTNATEHLVKNPFSYCFGYSQKDKCLPAGTVLDRSSQGDESDTRSWDWELPGAEGTQNTSTLTTYKPSKKYYPQGDQRDTIVDIIYWADKYARLPKATDWVKIRPPDLESGGPVFRDIEGNGPNPREIGVLISGTNVNKKDQVKIATIDPTIPPDDPRSTAGGTFIPGYREGDPYNPDWFTDEVKVWAKDNLYKPGNVTEFLPLPSDDPKYINSDTIKAYYPGTVGTLFQVGHGIFDKAEEVMKKCTNDYKTTNQCKNKNGVPLTPENIADGISINASVYYHTNIGNYTAHRDRILANCTDSTFLNVEEKVRNPSYGNNCLGNEYNLYLAWDLKTNKKRYVGVGAYVAISKVHVLLEYINAEGKDVKERVLKDEAVNMFGVRRGK